MNDNILRAIESLCDDIATNTNAEDNQKRANAILALAFGGTFTPEEIEEDYTEDDSVAGAEKDKIKFPKPGEQFEYNGVKFTALGEEQGGILAIVSELLKDEMPLDESNKNDWRTSSLRKYLNGEYLEQFNRGDLLPFVSDLTSDDGMKTTAPPRITFSSSRATFTANTESPCRALIIGGGRLLPGLATRPTRTSRALSTPRAEWTATLRTSVTA